MNSNDITTLLDSLAPEIAAMADSRAKTIIQILLTIIHAQQREIQALKMEVQDLKEKLNINSNNSSKPPSSDQNNTGNTQKKSKKKRAKGGQPGHKGVTRTLLSQGEVDHVLLHQPPKHCTCGGKVNFMYCYHRHQVYDLPPVKPIVTEHQLIFGICEGCDANHFASLPSHVPTGILGAGFLALISALTSDYKMSKRDVVRFFSDLFNLPLCVATVKRAEETMSQALIPPVETAKVYVKTQNRVNCDETSHSECGKRKWAWVAVANCVAVLLITATRSTLSAKALLGEGFKGILGSDRYCAYNWIAAACRQVCWAHLIRDFRKIAERPGKSKRVGLRLLVYAKYLFHYWHQVRDGTLTREKFKELMVPIRHQVELLLTEGTGSGHSKTQGTCFEILKLKEALWTFIDVVGVDPTNNIAERVLRNIVIWRKVSFGTWSVNGTLYLERVMTVVATCRLQNRSVFGFLRDTMQANFEGTPPPSLLPEAPVQNNALLMPT